MELRNLLASIDGSILYDCTWSAYKARDQKMGLRRDNVTLRNEIDVLKNGGETIRPAMLADVLYSDGILWLSFLVNAKTYVNDDKLQTDQKNSFRVVVDFMEKNIENGNENYADFDYARYWCDKGDYVEIFDTNELVSKYFDQLASNIALIILNSDRHVIGIITTTDLRKDENRNATIKSIMTLNPECFLEDSLMKDVYERLYHPMGNQPLIHRVPIIDSNGKFKGVVTFVEARRWRELHDADNPSK